MTATAPLPQLITTGEAAKRADVSIRTIHEWLKAQPDLVCIQAPTGRLLYADRFDAFAAKRRLRRPLPQPTRVGESGHHAAE